jgi:hypothetical protein
MAGNVKSEYDRVKGTDVLEFWKLFDMWQLQEKADRARYLKQKANNGR